MTIQIDGKFCDVIEQDSCTSSENIRSLMRRSEKVRFALAGTVPIKLVTVPGKLMNIVTKEPSGPVYRIEEYQDSEGEWHKVISPPFQS